MSKQTKALKLALERLQARTDTAGLDAIAAINEALAEQPAPAQEPVFRFQMQLKPGWGSQYPYPCVIGEPDLRSLFGKIGDIVTFYTTPPAPAQKPVIPQGWKLKKVEDDVRLTSPSGERWRFRATDGVDLFVFNFLKAMLNSAPPSPAQPDHVEDVLAMVEPPTKDEIRQAFKAHDARFPLVSSMWSFEAGIEFAEKHYGITKGKP